MSSISVEPCYIPLNACATQSRAMTEKLTLVIPTLNEVANLPLLLERVTASLEKQPLAFEILIVDDGSCDGTEELISSIITRDTRIRLLVRREERGLSGAILHGWENCSASILGVIDADLQHPPELLPALVGVIQEGYDVAIGSRYARGAQVHHWSGLRRLLSMAAVWVTYPIQRCTLKAQDPMSGYFLVRRKCVEKVEFQSTGFKLLLEILVRGRVASVQEVPIIFGRRLTGRSKANLGVAWEYLRLLSRLYASRYVRRPSARLTIDPQHYVGD
ncbi:polyprenol monophosphomannose synthase [Acidobacteria bacterium AB60]|nr:polyprenol monophosphomannose synthase [Acidobacteria bacterium AB60]